MLYSLFFLNFLILNKNCYKFRLFYILSLVVVIFILFFKFFNLKLNVYENNFWLLVEILNNNNKSLIFFFSLLLYSFIVISFNKNKLTLKCYLFLMFLTVLCIFVYQTNFNYWSWFLLYNNVVNTSLVNGVVLIHPILIYITYFVLIINFLILKNNFYKINFIIYTFSSSTLLLLVCSFLALFLGGWWAQQELNWGGWWNWDFVEIIALVFFITVLFITHNNFSKYYNNLFLTSKIVMFYLFCFFIFVRMDVLSSIHSFNSFSILNNLNNYLTTFFIILIFFVYKVSLIFFEKNRSNAKFLPILSLFFKFINFLFIFYFFLNVFIVIYLNYQFVDITKYVKIILLLTLYLYVLYEFRNKSSTLLTCIFLIKTKFSFFCTTNILNIFFFINLLNFFKKYKYINTKSIISHICFIYFILYIKYNWIQIYFNTHNFAIYLNNFLINSDYLIHNNSNTYKYNYNSIFNFNLNNFYFTDNKNNLFFLKEMYTNNIVYNNTSYSSYNFENFILLLFYNINILFYLIVVLSVVLV